METLLFLLGYLLAAGICILVGRGMWRTWRRHRARVREAIHPLMVKPPVCDVPPAGWTCSREPGHDGPCAARPLQLRPGQIVEVPHMRQDYVDFIHYAQAEAERIPKTAAEALNFLGDVYMYLLTQHTADEAGVKIVDDAVADVMRAARHNTRLRPQRVLADDMVQQWRLGR